MIFMVFLLYSTISLSEQRRIVVDGKDGNDTLCKQNISPCKTLDVALNAVTDNTTVQILNGTYPHNTNTTLTYNNVTITGRGPDVTIVNCSENGIGLGFLNVTNISIRGLTLLGCGQLRNSTTRSRSDDSILLFPVSMYFLGVVNVIIDSVVVSNSTGMGVVMYDVTGTVIVSNSIFSNNSVPSHEAEQYPGGGGVSVEFYSVNNNATYFNNCTFKLNNATSVDDVKYVSVVFDSPQFGRGGGLSVFFKGIATGNNIVVNNSKFVSNQAKWGAGFHSDLLDHSADNNITISNSLFIDNHCGYEHNVYAIGTGGGGIRIALHFYSDIVTNNSNNHVKISRCNFMNNSAYFGGGVSFITMRGIKNDVNHTISFEQCKWVNNTARTGSAVDLNVHTLPVGLVAAAHFKDCSFINNSNNYITTNSTFLLGIGSLYSDGVPVDFDGNCEFLDNTDSAVAVTASRLTFLQGSSVVFENNTGYHGAAIALLGNSYMFVWNATSLNFSGNQAKAKGGAIYCLAPSERDFISSRKCFVQYYDQGVSPYHWNTSFVFRDNNASTARNSIFVTTLLPCIWNQLLGLTHLNSSYIKDVLYWNGTFDYGNSSNVTNEISTEPLDVEKVTNSLIVIAPGQSYDLNLHPIDDKEDSTTAVFLVHAIGSPNVSVDETSLYTSQGLIQLRGQPQTNFTLKLQTVGVRPLSVAFQAKLGDCPPGYYIDDIHKFAVCRCSSYKLHKSYHGVAKCDDQENKLVAYLQPQIWAGYHNSTEGQQFITGDCPDNYCFVNGSNLIPLPSNSCVHCLDIILCRPKKRTGRLCGMCMEGNYVYANSPTYDCGNCNDKLSRHGILFIILLKYVPMTIFLCIIMFFNISLVSGPLNAFILFSQIIPAADLYAGGVIKWPPSGKGLAKFATKSYQFLYGILNLNFIETLTDPFCTFKYRSTLPILILEYFSAFYPLVLFLLFFSILPWVLSQFTASRIRCIQSSTLALERMCIRFRTGWSIKNSIIHGLVTFLVLSYVKFTAVSWHILAYGVVYGAGGENSDIAVAVSWADGTKPYLSHVHGKYAAVAFVILICFVLLAPLLLLSYPYLPKLLSKLKLDEKWIIQKLVLTPLGHAVPFFDAIQGCFKDEYRFFASFSFVYRLFAWAISSFSSTVPIRYLWQLGFYTLMLFLHSFCQPYKKRWHNLLDTSIFSLLIVINAISFYRYYGFVADFTTSAKTYWVQLLLIWCPLVYIAAYMLKQSLKWWRPRIRLLATFIRQLSGENVPDGYRILEIPSPTNNDGNAEFPYRLYDDSTPSEEEMKNSTNWSHETPMSGTAGTTIQDYGTTKSNS